MTSTMTRKVITSFDKTTHCNSFMQSVEEKSSIYNIEGNRIIARGSGLSYCNASAFEKGLSIDMTPLDKIVSFDKDEGYITVEAGITVGELSNFLIEKQFLLPVMPGYPKITVGGCIAFNVHGKSQSRVGLFMDWVEEILLYHPEKGTLMCSKKQNPDIFYLSMGGLGLTGIILSAKLKVKKTAGNIVTIKSVKVNNIKDAVYLMREEEDNFEFIYSWNNFNLKLKSFGQGIVYLEQFKQAFSTKAKPKKYVNNIIKNCTYSSFLNGFTIPLMCQIYYYSNLLKPVSVDKNLYEAGFPIYGKEIYYHLFGKEGFREYQVLFEFSQWNDAITKIEEYVSIHKISISLASLKIFKGSTHNISFSGTGVCLAMDVPNDKKSIPFFNRLDEIAIEHRGLINLSKDSRADGLLISKTYPEYNGFRQKIREYDPSRLFVSELSNRINI